MLSEAFHKGAEFDPFAVVGATIYFYAACYSFITTKADIPRLIFLGKAQVPQKGGERG